MPVQVRGYKVIDRQLWFAGLYNGKLLHLTNLKTKKVEKSIIAVKDVLEGLRNAGFDENALKDIQQDASKRVVESPEPELKNS